MLNPGINRFKEYTGLFGKESSYLRRTGNFLVFSIYEDTYNEKKYVGALMNFIDISPKSHKPYDSTSTVAPDTTTVPPDTYLLNKQESCTSKNALQQFNSYMKFYYPDWKIYGKPVINESSDCTYRIQFTTMDPHIRYQKEVIIVEISFNFDYSKYYFNTIRGTLY